MKQRDSCNEKSASLDINRDGNHRGRSRPLGQHYVLNSAKLDKAIKTEVPLGTPKAQVITFIETRHPVAYDDMGAQLKARLQGLAENMVYRKDIVITFDFSQTANSCPTRRKNILRSYSRRYVLISR